MLYALCPMHQNAANSIALVAIFLPTVNTTCIVGFDRNRDISETHL